MPHRYLFFLRFLIGAGVLFVFLRRCRVELAFTVVLASVALDLGLHLHDLRHLYQGTLPPEILESNRPSPSQERILTSTLYQFEDESSTQKMRYAELVKRERTLFSPVRNPYRSKDIFRSIRKGKRWDTYLMQEGYFSLIHSSRSEVQLADYFLLNRLPFDLRIQSAPGFFSSQPTVGSLEITEMNVNDATVVVNAQRAGFLYRAEGWHPHWKARVNGKETPLIKANENFQAVAIPKGRSTVQFVFDPIVFKIAVSVFYVVIAIVLTAALIPGLRTAQQRCLGNSFGNLSWKLVSRRIWG